MNVLDNLPLILASKFYEVKAVDYDKVGIGLVARCLTCSQLIKGRRHPFSNFTTHIKVGNTSWLFSFIGIFHYLLILPLVILQLKHDEVFTMYTSMKEMSAVRQDPGTKQTGC